MGEPGAELGDVALGDEAAFKVEAPPPMKITGPEDVGELEWKASPVETEAALEVRVEEIEPVAEPPYEESEARVLESIDMPTEDLELQGIDEALTFEDDEQLDDPGG